MQEGKLEDPGKPMEASLDWKPNPSKCQDQEARPLVQSEGRYASLLLELTSKGRLPNLSVKMDLNVYKNSKEVIV